MCSARRLALAAALSLVEVLAWLCYMALRVRFYLDLLGEVPPLSWDAAALVLAFAFEFTVATVVLLGVVALTLEIAECLNSDPPPRYA